MIDPRLMPNNEDVAVLIDTHLIVNKLGQLNKPLLKFLKTYGLTRLYLFDDFRFTTEALLNHMTIWFTLNELGFFVYGILTPHDLAWYEMFIAKKRGFSEKLHFNLQEPTGAFHYAVTMMNTAPKHRLPGETEVGSALVRHHVKKSPEAKAFKHIKGLMFQFFLDALPHRTNRILILDHDPLVIRTVLSVMPSKRGQEIPPVAAITVPQDEDDDNFYIEHILKHPIIAIKSIKDALFHRQYEISGGANPFLRSSENKRKVLSALSYALEFNHHDDPMTVEKLMDECLEDSILRIKPPKIADIPKYKDLRKRKKRPKATADIPPNYAIISQHRNIFASSHPKEEPKTLSLIKLIKATFGDVVVPSIKHGRVVPQPMFVYRTKPRIISPLRFLVERDKRKLKRSTSCPTIMSCPTPTSSQFKRQSRTVRRTFSNPRL